MKILSLTRLLRGRVQGASSTQQSLDYIPYYSSCEGCSKKKFAWNVGCQDFYSCGDVFSVGFIWLSGRLVKLFTDQETHYIFLRLSPILRLSGLYIFICKFYNF